MLTFFYRACRLITGIILMLAAIIILTKLLPIIGDFLSTVAGFVRHHARMIEDFIRNFKIPTLK